MRNEEKKIYFIRAIMAAAPHVYRLLEWLKEDEISG